MQDTASRGDVTWSEGRSLSSDTTVASFEFSTYYRAPGESPLVKGDDSSLQAGQYVSFLPPCPPRRDLPHHGGDVWLDFFFLDEDDDEELEDDVFYPDDYNDGGGNGNVNDATSLPLTTNDAVTSGVLDDERDVDATTEAGAPGSSILSESFRRLELGQVDATLRKLTQNKAQSMAHALWQRRRRKKMKKKTTATSLSESSASDRRSASGSEAETGSRSQGSPRRPSPRSPHWFGATSSTGDVPLEPACPSPRRRLFDYIVAHDEEGQQELHLVRRDSVRLRQWQISQTHRLRRRQNKGCRTLPRK